MMLLTKELEEKLPKLYTNEKKNPEDINIIVKFFDPSSSWTWFATEGEKQVDGDWLFFGMVHGIEKELGYFSLNELKKVKGRFGLGIERDRHYGFNHKLSEVM